MDKSIEILKPFLKWPGGKSRHREKIQEIIKNVDFNKASYYEPFLGGGSVFFHFQPKKAVVNDLNSELINTYQVIRDFPEELINQLQKHKENFKGNDKNYYYEIRSMDRNENFSNISSIDKAARIIFLNKTCFNGIYRVNQKGFFNTPIGKYENPTIFDEENIFGISNYLKSEKITISSKDYKEVVKTAKKGDLIYFDPPYDYDEKSIFLGYGEKIFNKSDLLELRDLAYDLMKKGCYVILSNNYTELVKELFIETYKNKTLYFKELVFDVKRLVNSNAALRSNPVKEVLLYGSNIPTS